MRPFIHRVGVLSALALLAVCTRPAPAYVEVAMSLGAVIAQSSNIVLMQVEKVDKEKNMIIYRKVQDIKGKHPADVIKHNIGRGGFHPREWQYPMQWAEPGKAAVFFHNGGASETCIGNDWYQAYAGGEWWNMSHGEPFLLRSYAGKPEKLAAFVTQILAGQEVVVPCMVDGDKEVLKERRAKMQRLRVSLKLQDYNAKRDFVGWGGGEDFVRLSGMPGFTHLSSLPRVDPEAQAINVLDIDGDGKPDLSLVGAGKVALIQNGGDSLNEMSLPGAVGCRAAVWADYNGDGRPDLLLATLTGPRLYTNLVGGFRDDTHILPAEPYYNLTAAAWLDQDGDGKPDILLGNGFHGLRLYHNAFPVDQIKKLIVDLGNDQAPVRDQATQELDKIGPIAEGMVQVALQTSQSMEVKTRAQRLIDAWKAKAAAPKPPNQPAVQGIRWFDDLSAKVGLGAEGIASNLKGDTLTVADVNGDGRPDFLYGAGSGILVMNTPTGFIESKDSGIAFKTGKVGPIFADFNGDGRLDLFVPQNGTCKLFRNNGSGKFADVTAQAGDLARPLPYATSAACGDFYNDGKMHLVVGCLRGPNRFFRNAGNGQFKDESDALGLNQRIFNTQAVCMVDLNADGVLDMVFNNEGQESAVLLGNKSLVDQKRMPVTVQVAGSGGVIGSRIKILDKDGKPQGGVQYICGGEGRGGQKPLQARFALTPGAYKVEVRYSSGITRVKDITVAAAPVKGVVDDQTPKAE